MEAGLRKGGRAKKNKEPWQSPGGDSTINETKEGICSEGVRAKEDKEQREISGRDPTSNKTLRGIITCQSTA